MKELLEAQLLTVVLVQDPEHEVGGGQAVVEVREKVCELFDVQAAVKVIEKAFIHLLNLLGVMLGVLGQPEDVGLRKSVEESGSYSF